MPQTASATNRTQSTAHGPQMHSPCAAQLHKSKIKKLHSPCAIAHNSHKTNRPGICPTVRKTRGSSQEHLPGKSREPLMDSRLLPSFAIALGCIDN
jgi:hypothetical protein